MTRSACEAGEPSLRERLEVHRRIEWMRVHDAWPDELDAKEDMLGALADVGVDVPEDAVVQELLLDEVARELERFATYLVDHQEAVYGEAWMDEEATPPVDPFGELAGGRPQTSQLLVRRVDEEASRAEVEMATEAAGT
jgi:hypothetical protein